MFVRRSLTIIVEFSEGGNKRTWIVSLAIQTGSERGWIECVKTKLNRPGILSNRMSTPTAKLVDSDGKMFIGSSSSNTIPAPRCITVSHLPLTVGGYSQVLDGPCIVFTASPLLMKST